MNRFVSLLLLPAIGAITLGPCARLRADEPAQWAEAHVDELFTLYKHFHQNPELSLEEKETSARLAKELKAAGLEVTTGVGGYGVVGILKNGDGPKIMVRTDLDALPVTEKTELVYASKVRAKDETGKDTGVMHACGHDIHITCLVGTARYMAENKDRWRGTLMCIGQPAEERVGGAKMMLDDGLFTKIMKPDLALALHCDSKIVAGHVGYRSGYILANVDSVDVTFYGRGGHGAHPYATIDPIVMAAHFVVDVQSVVSREIKPGEPAVITVGSIHGGTKHNIIGDFCHLQLTVRSYTDEVRKKLLDGIERKAKAAAASAGAPEPKVVTGETTPSTFNDEELTAKVTKTFRRVFGDDKVESVPPSMGGEDFSLYGRAGVPACMFSLGTIDAKRLAGYERVGQPSPGLHSALFYPDAEPTIKTGVTAMTSVLLDLLPVAKGAAAETKGPSKKGAEQ
jgi:hippurate hydrolase